MKDWDPPLLNQPISNSLLSIEYFKFEAEQHLKGMEKLEAIRRVAELRKSCGVKPELSSTINVRVPPRYRSA